VRLVFRGAKALNTIGILTIVNSGLLGIKFEETKKLTLTRVEMKKQTGKKIFIPSFPPLLTNLKPPFVFHLPPYFFRKNKNAGTL
jgi:hypothetical protein